MGFPMLRVKIYDAETKTTEEFQLTDVGKKTSAHVFEGLPASGRGDGVLDNTAGSPSASCGLPARVRSEG
jgi:hypothetical protein